MTLETVRVRPPEPSWTDVMEKLRDRIGSRVSIHYASDGSQGIRAGILTEVKPFQSVKIDDFEIPFIGRRAAIQRIMSDETLYRLSIISERYGGLREDEVKSLRKFVFRGEDREIEEALSL